MAATSERHAFPVFAGILLGVGLGGFFDGIVLHQVLQWHHIATSAGYPADSLRNLELNTLLDGIFHACTWVFTAIGVLILWQSSRKPHHRWSARLLPATMLMGFGAFNLIEGAVDHHLLGLHHVNETVPRDQWIFWDIGFLVWGAAMLVGGWALFQSGSKQRGFPVEAATWGGVVRSGPGPEFAMLATLAEGEGITLVENTGIVWKEYPWFKVLYKDRKAGYQWGGIVRSLGDPIEGASHGRPFEDTARAGQSSVR